MHLYEILVPTVRNGPSGGGGTPIRTQFHRLWDAKVRAITGGLTIMTPAKGQWIAPDGKLFSERMIPVRIMATPQQITQIADMTAAYYEQQAVMYYRISDEVVVRHYA